MRTRELESLGTLRSNDVTAMKTSKKTIGLISKTTTLHLHPTFLYISLPFLHDYDVKMPNFARFVENVLNKQRRIFFYVSELGYGPLEFKFRKVRLHLTK